MEVSNQGWVIEDFFFLEERREEANCCERMRTMVQHESGGRDLSKKCLYSNMKFQSTRESNGKYLRGKKMFLELWWMTQFSLPEVKGRNVYQRKWTKVGITTSVKITS